MSISLEAFPTLTTDLITRSGLHLIKWNHAHGYVDFSYIDDKGHKLSLEATSDDDGPSPVFKIVDKAYEWTPDDNNMIVDINFDIIDPSVLFGAEGIVPFNGELWVGLIMTSKAASYRDAFIIKKKIDKTNCCTSKKNKKINIAGSISIPPGILRGNVSFELVFVLGNPGSNNSEEEQYMAKKVGTVLGTIAEFRVFIDGDGAIFPVKEESAPGAPLWRVKYDCVNPESTPFDEDSFCLYLNTVHPDYEILAFDGRNENTLIYEIAASAFEILFSNVFGDDDAVDSIVREEFDSDSVAFVVSQMMDLMEIETSDSSEEMHYKIREFIMKERQ